MLDASTRIDVLNLLGELKSHGLGILFITHDLNLGNYISDTTMILRKGSVVEMGATDRVFENPVHPYTRTLLASVPQLHTRWQDAGHASAPGPSPADVGEGPAACGDGALVEVESDHLVARFAPEAGERA
jgi:ABC-type oligopeptide transport system ATPase subunit